MEGIELGIEEIVQLMVIAFTLLVIGGGILYIANPDHLRAKAGASEVSYISSMISNNGIVVEIIYDDAKIKENNNLIIMNYKSAKYDKSYFGEQVEIKTIGTNTFRICSYGTKGCSDFNSGEENGAGSSDSY